jgi:hypothetical protein
LSYDQEEESLVDWVSPLVYDIYSKEKKNRWKRSNNIEIFVVKTSIYHVLDESPKSKVFDLDVNEVDFLLVENILSNFPDANVFDDFYVEKNFMFKSEETVDPFWEIFLGHELEKMCNSHVKP